MLFRSLHVYLLHRGANLLRRGRLCVVLMETVSLTETWVSDTRRCGSEEAVAREPQISDIFGKLTEQNIKGLRRL